MADTLHDHDESVDTSSSRPDDPDVVARESGKTTRKRSSANQRQRQSDDDNEPVERLADDVLLGAKRIAGHITALGFPVDETDVYYLHRAKKWPFNKYGVFLIASKRRLTDHAEKLLRGPTAA
jgi:hypothetical protein